ncbi:MAG: hypothetical protein CW694_01695 [Candidatus Syntrophoarchaeum sp. WYZ-LMO15]|nr:MAG: hypothetical protein CW694_01695 [Candidatus Syntrophoarchaeum sp. WYZ-LMO15]
MRPKRFIMRILAVDIGMGTQDIMVVDDATSPLEGSYKLVLPSPTRYFAEMIRSVRGDILIYGDTMGGGPIARAIIDHLRRYRVYMTPDAARTIRDDLSRVEKLGVTIIPEKEIDNLRCKRIKISDIDLERLEPQLAAFGIDTSFDVVAVAVQDHGVAPPGVSDREHRFTIFKELLESTRRIEEVSHFNEVKGNFSRMKSILNRIKSRFDGDILLMDTGIAAALGSLVDGRMKGVSRSIAVNIGNGHTLAVTIKNREICGFFEHHTRMIDRDKLRRFIDHLIDGSITFEEVFEDGGHGALLFEPVEPEVTTITGPKRYLMEGVGLHVAPAGDMMMAGPVGLIEAVRYRLGL